MQVNWNTVLSGTIIFIIVFFIKILLDFNLAQFVVKYFSWVPLRNYFRSKPISIKGDWEENWDLEITDSFKEITQRHSHPTINQLDKYCYSEFIANGVSYVIFGKVINNFFIGDWYDKNDPIGYFGTFHLLIIDSTSMKGKWIGHSKKINGVRQGDWTWKKIKK
jgi:hypothetical protein